VKDLSELLGVHKHDSLSHFAQVEDLLHEVCLLALLALVLELLNVVKLQLLLFDVNLLGLCNDGPNLFFDLFWICGAEKNVLDGLLEGRNVLLYNFSHGRKVAFLLEKDVCLVDHEASQLRQVNGLLASATFEGIVELSKSCDDDVLAI
jgi:hypothetical protein